MLVCCEKRLHESMAVSLAKDLSRLAGRTIARASVDVGKAKIVIELEGGGKLVARARTKDGKETDSFVVQVSYV